MNRQLALEKLETPKQTYERGMRRRFQQSLARQLPPRFVRKHASAVEAKPTTRRLRKAQAKLQRLASVAPSPLGSSKPQREVCPRCGKKARLLRAHEEAVHGGR